MKINQGIFFDTSSICAVFINVLLITLIFKRSPKLLGSYKSLMIYINVFELTYAILYFAEKPNPFTKKSAFFLIVNWKESIFPKPISCLLNLLFVGFYGTTIAILALHFVYRFLSVTCNKLLNSFNSWKIILWFALPLLNGTMFMLIGSFVMCSSPESDRFMKENYQAVRENTTSFEDLYYLGPFLWPKLGNSSTEQYFSWKDAIGGMAITGAIGLSCFLMLYLGLRCYRCINATISTASSSSHLKTIQKQLLNALVFQSLIPVLLLHIPASIIFVTIFLGKSTEAIGETVSLTVAWYPALNPLPALFIIKSYRDTIGGFLVALLRRVVPRTNVVATYEHPSPGSPAIRETTVNNLNKITLT
ncbi:Serpentine receptor class r-10 [Caenorhabditis elegans]|uniref:Serpentine receptor class r-10 n=1 Tax=Caenorhabditis elegans TaxID=6239 RepID=O44699_CAEEL|nr:Seven TM Receptor [Caenorhabditis elegans]CCD67425.1 Seven TM Receptor [Caenorhabditis elegans]|eukprot:NP_503587.2 Seven TM Receptor [Caenorhabditis elegans]